MRLLVVAATSTEIAPLVEALGEPPARGHNLPAPRGQNLHTYGGHARQVDVLVTGVGMVATAAWCSRALMETPYDLALNLGVCGSFDPSLEPGRVVHVVSDRFAELGAEDGNAFLTVQALGLLGDDQFPFTGGWLVNAAPPASSTLIGLPSVRGITVNTVHGSEPSIAATVGRFKPDIESMEGGAFMYACLIGGVPFAQVRAVSNAVERRNRAAWKMADAIARLNVAAINMVEQA